MIEPVVAKQEVKPIEEIILHAKENAVEPVVEKVKPQLTETHVNKELPKIAININDKFRFINELFAANANEYNIAIEQINSVITIHEMNNYLNGLKSIYGWKDDNEVVKNLYTLSQKRFS